MNWFPSLLAAGDDETWVKIAIGVIAGVFWLISSIASAMKKRQTTQRPVPYERTPAEHRGQHEAPPLPRRTSAPLPPLPPQRTPRQSQRARPVRPKPQQRSRPLRSGDVPAAPPPLSHEPVVATRRQAMAPSAYATEEIGVPISAMDVAASEITSESRKQEHASTKRLHELLSSKNIRSQLVLMELLQPPVSLREPSPRQP